MQLIVDEPLSGQEKEWLLARRVTRLTDNHEVQIYPMGAERYLAEMLSPEKNTALHNLVQDKSMLVIPGYGNNSFLFAKAGAKKVDVYDKDPVTIAWMKAFFLFYNWRWGANPTIAELMQALTCWYPPRLKLATLVSWQIKLNWLINPQNLRRHYLFLMLSIVQEALRQNILSDYAMPKKLHFHCGELTEIDSSGAYELIYIPFLLGVRNGIEEKENIVRFIDRLLTTFPQARLLITPAVRKREFLLLGKNYFVTSGYDSLTAMTEIANRYRCVQYPWFRQQGLLIVENS